MSTEILLNWIADTFAKTDVIDLYFILSDLVDIPISEAELCETAYFDAMASESVNQYTGDNTPIGKTVI